MSKDKAVIILSRHPETEGNILSNEEATQLKKPNHLFRPTESGLIQMEAFLQTYIATDLPVPEAILCSTFLRTQVLAEKIGRHFGVPFIEDSRLDEKWDGIFHSLTKEEIQERYAEQIVMRKKYGWYHFTPFGGENGPAVELRIRSLFVDIANSLEGKTVFIAAHGNWLHLFEGLALGLSWQEVERRRKELRFPNCSLSIYKFTPPFTFTQTIDRFAPWAKEKTDIYF